MNKLYCISLSHKQHDIQVRSRFTLAHSDIETYLEELKNITLVYEVFLLSTCNRFEIICVASDVGVVCSWLAFKSKSEVDELNNYFNIYSGIDALKHILRVTSGLESRLFGEKNINGQVKQAFLLAKKYNLIGKTLDFIYQYAFQVSKKVQAKLDLPFNSITQCFFKVHHEHFRGQTNLSYLIVGSGKLCTEVVHIIKQYQPKSIFIISHNPERVSEELKEISEKVGELSDILPHFKEIDVCFTATNSTNPIIDSCLLGEFDPEKNVLVADASLPPTVHPAIREIDYFSYYDVDDLAAISQQENFEEKKDITYKLDTFVEAEVIVLKKKLDTNFVCNIIEPERMHLKSYVEHIRNWVVNDPDFHEHPEKAMLNLSKELSGILLHMTTIFLRKCCEEHDLYMIKEIKKIIDNHDNNIRLLLEKGKCKSSANHNDYGQSHKSDDK